PWSVDRVELRLAQGEVRVWVALPTDTLWVCPECHAPAPIQGARSEAMYRSHMSTATASTTRWISSAGRSTARCRPRARLAGGHEVRLAPPSQSVLARRLASVHRVRAQHEAEDVRAWALKETLMALWEY